MKYIVTGGCGFIGSHLVEYLVNNGYKVIIFDNLSTGSLKNIEGLNVEFYNEPYEKIWKLSNIDGIFHLGMPSSSPMYKEDPYLVGRTINEAITIFEYARKNKCKIVYASTSSIYNGNPIPYREDMTIYVTDYYTECRYAIERLARLYYDLYNVKSVGLRLFSVYGPREEHKGKYANIVSQFLWSMIKDERPIIYSDGNQTRDFIYVSDVVNAFILAMEKDINYDIFNVGTGKNYSFNEVINLLNKYLGKDIKPIYKPNPIKNYVYHTLADTTKAEKILGFKAKISLEEGIKKLISMYISKS
ncbi:MAG: NAD-dependent epimerase/dehydratase family protein [Candidatus Verstraetearchaeota archaeon]|nr:NAD-dependent epimerase/dehydratase family protein [Candidatus Verstraetearchaeota archaeon]